MKLKIIFLIISASFLTYLIFTKNYEKTFNIFSIYDKTTSSIEYNNYIKDKLNNKLKHDYIEYNKDNLEIEDLNLYIETNKDNIQQEIYKSDILILDIGEFEIKNNLINTNLLNSKLKELFIRIRKLNNKEIIYIKPKSLKISYPIKELCKKYNIEYIDINYDNTLDINKIISNKILLNIEKDWNI